MLTQSTNHVQVAGRCFVLRCSYLRCAALWAATQMKYLAPKYIIEKRRQCQILATHVSVSVKLNGLSFPARVVAH